MVWAQGNAEQSTDIKYAAIDQDGKVLLAPRVLLSEVNIQDVTMSVRANQIDVFWAARGEGERLDMRQVTMDTRGQILQRRTVSANSLIEVSDLQVEEAPNGGQVLVWTDHEGEYTYVKTLGINASGKVGAIQRVTSGQISSTNPRLYMDSHGQFHLAWCKVLSRDIYELLYQPIQNDGTVVQPARLIDKGRVKGLTLVERDGRMYFAWDKNNAEVPELRDIYGTVLDLKKVVGELKVLQLSSTDSSNSAPVLAFDAQNRLHMLSIKLKDEYRALVDQSYVGSFAQVYKKPSWVYPEPSPAATEINLLTDQKNNLYLACMAVDYHKKNSYLHYANTAKPNVVNAWQIMGFNVREFKQNLLFNLTYILSSPLLFLLVFAIFFTTFGSIVFTTFLYSGLKRILRKSEQISKYLNNFYVSLGVIGGVQIFVVIGLLVFIGFEWPLDIIRHHFIYVFGLTSLATVMYSVVNRLHVKYDEPLFVAMLLIAWDYWLWIVIMTLNLPNINFIIPPVI